MISAILLALSALAYGALYLFMDKTIEDLRARNAQLHADNQALMTALANASGQQLQFEVVTPPEKSSPPPPRRPISPPYWKSKEEKTVEIGNKTIILKS